ncbi:molybdenum cofactor guanylyltransferase MobA [Piscinibacter sakaiensis]|uniref:Molybdenum cofactor guanylyltransferase n=1 Tax=Piscinibacter sakaiensis TaxID=1547922 RepID=A0A0K8NU07_PISS1|nr:molybdenum cofactor guanylyltransferase MobA [Piscinibacter sakaiensis]GAP33739.1 molybdopterin-guanine dinucleotide biosynthesis protein MobA [Piscinibacter sakaiensis]
MPLPAPIDTDDDRPRPPLPTREAVTGLVLAGGRARRMGGVDKGLQAWQGRPLVAHVLARLAPQVAAVAINANRSLEAYATFGLPLWPDRRAAFPGPLAGLEAGLAAATTPWLLTVPCDAPGLPADLRARLGEALAVTGADVALAVTREGPRTRAQPVFALWRVSLAPALRAHLDDGGARVEDFVRRSRHVEVVFDEPAAFANANTLEELAALPPPRP